MVVVAALALLGVVGYFANQLWAQTPANSPAATKVGLINLVAVLKGFNKHKTYTNELDQIRLQYEKKDGDLRKLLQQWKEYLTGQPGKEPLKADKRAEAELTIKDI